MVEEDRPRLEITMKIESFDGQRKGEVIKAVWRSHMWVMSRAGFIFAFLVVLGSMPLAFTSVSWASGFLLVVVAVAGIYLLLQIYLFLSTIYILTNERILSITQTKLLMRTINELPLRNIQNVSHTRKGLFQMLMDYGEVEIQTAGSTTAMTLKNVPHPYRVQQKILVREERIKD
jgi:membrane protein YdbS with pleckstrin-like domain